MTTRKTKTVGCVHVYTGSGKGKTTAAIGLAVRALGTGRRVYVGQFMKSGGSAEIKALKAHFPECEVECFGLGRFIHGAPSSEDLQAARRGLHRVRKIIMSGNHDLVIADELNGAVKAGLISVDEQLGLIETRPAHVELVITGRNAHQRLIEKADLVTEMRKVKHYFDKGMPAREGIEY